MEHSMRQLHFEEFPALLKEIPDPPETLYIKGDLPSSEAKYLCVVGSRSYSPYGKEVCEKLIGELRGYPIVIVSGLALGIDGIAHRSALSTGLTTIAVPGSGLSESVLYPRAHLPLSREILKKGGALISPFEPEFKATPYSFPERNRIMAGLSHATLVIEATEKSGTLITSRLALDYNRDVLTVPGSIFDSQRAGPHMLLRLGATLVRHGRDILEALHITVEEKEIPQKDFSEDEKRVVALLTEPLSRDELIRALAMPVRDTNVLLATMELKGIIKESMGLVRVTFE